MIRNEIMQFMDQEISAINAHPKVQKTGTVGKILGYGTYGFVCEWLDGSGFAKAVKILDPDYVTKKNSIAAPRLNQILSSASVYLRTEQSIHEQFCAITIDEAYASEKLAGTKNKHLMTILDGSQAVKLENRYVQLIVMPKLMTIEQLPVSNSPEQQIADILIQCCEGLHALHEEPKILRNTAIGLDALIHNDLKPDNIFVASHTSGELSANWYIIGDYSACLNVKSLNDYTPGITYPEEFRQNPYCAPGPIGITSDIWSLGWILWYWMNGKQHPQLSDIESRADRAGTRKPKNWGDNPELWEVFLNMTEYDPSRRYQSVDIVQSELYKALQAREQRLSRNRETSSTLTGAAGAAGFAALLYLLAGLKGRSKEEKKDADGFLHGKNAKAIPLLGGTFQGEWHHGFPYKGNFVYDGIKKTGNWVVKENYKVPFSPFGYMTFSGLICTDAGEDFYQGKTSIYWNSSTSFEAEIRNGAFCNGIMTYHDGTVRSGNWELVHNDTFSGVFCGAGNELHGCGIRYFPGGVYYEGEIQCGQAASGELVFPNRRISSGEPAHRNAWNLLTQIQQYQGSFSGTWGADGYPEQGTYTYSTGASLSGSFSYVQSEDYTGMLQNGKACGIGTHPMTDGMVREGEFLRGCCNGNAIVQHDCGAYFCGNWKDGEILEGVLNYSDGTQIGSRDWNLTETKLHSGHVLRGIFCNHSKQACGIGTVLFMPQETRFCGEVKNNECKNGIYVDRDGNIL